jgi:predicted dehydrogenase
VYKSVIIGLGQVAWEMDKNHDRLGIWTHAEAYTRCNSVDLVAGFDTIKEKRKAFSNHYPIKTYSNLDKMMQEEKPDIVSICTPTVTHLDIIRQLVEYPIKAIFCEKPLHFSSVHSASVVKLCEEKNIILAVNYMRRWENLYLKVKELIDSKELGTLKSVVGYTNTALYMNASHMIDLIIMFCGDIYKVCGKIDDSCVRVVHGVLDYGGFFNFSTFSNIEGFLYAFCDDTKKHQFELDLQFTNGRITVSMDGYYNWVFKYERSFFIPNKYELDTGVAIDFIPNERMISAVNNICNVLDGKDEIIKCTGRDAIKSIRTIEAFLGSEGETVYV